MNVVGQVANRLLWVLFIAAFAAVLASPYGERTRHRTVRCAHAPTAPHVPVAAPVVERAEFGLEEWTEEGGYVFTQTDRLPLVAGTGFGWRLKLANPAESVHVREEFVLPDAPSYWGVSEATTVSGDRRAAVTEMEVSPLAGWVTNGWTVTPGDPAGRYELRVFIDGQHVRTFAFDAE